ncbi:MAG: methyltransferase domain-containing protein [Terracidiphilus sp.]|nr:methyltransferase domain-containing protein [Terracidiphilus sp.]MDR3798355.1 methyltransferase domain-containing protein [Terracidiphilus sp.]
MSEKRFDATLAYRLDLPERITWLPPQEVIRALALEAGATVVDLGAGTGYFALPFALAVGAAGRVIAIDAQDEMLELLRRKIAPSAASNIELICAEADRIALPGSACDLFFLANVWHEIPDRAAALAEAKRVLKAQGRIAILDWRPDVEPEHGPPIEHRLTPASAVAELGAAGFQSGSQRNIGKYSWLVQATAGV